MNHNFEMKYDYRNLLIESKNNLSQFIYWTKYKYDEAGNRIRKTQYMWQIEGGIGGTDFFQSFYAIHPKLVFPEQAGESGEDERPPTFAATTGCGI